ncbi:hypothetical protein KIN20_005283 [Parelaphostrongylus tenuis]|uniref:Uncharacterized protein n=1 Tax=Parelaphostrongylus tenuis TaxID=148309 RepID=A0AAD5QIG8_PARTN|nr:hypothetical protein KIN20_005283 [Parelaphostrongylus tenuis]
MLYCVIIGESELSQRAVVDDINDVETASKSAAGRFQLVSALLNAGDLDLENNPRSRLPTKLSNKDQLIVALDDELSSSAR